MALFLVSGTSFAFAQYISCNLWAYGAIQAEESYYGSMALQDYTDGFNWYLDACNAAGGSQNIEDPVFM